MKTPWHDENGNLCFPYRAILDRVFIYPTPPPEKFRGKRNVIEIPGQFRKFYQDGTGILLSVGKGYYNKEDKWCPTTDQLRIGMKISYDKTVPWSCDVKGLDGKEYFVIICGVSDIYGILEDAYLIRNK